MTAWLGEISTPARSSIHPALGAEVVLHVHDEDGGLAWIDRDGVGPRLDRDVHHARCPQPRPTKGIFVAMMVMNCTLVSRGSRAMASTASPTCLTSKSGSGAIVPLACGTP